MKLKSENQEGYTNFNLSYASVLFQYVLIKSI